MGSPREASAATASLCSEVPISLLSLELGSFETMTDMQQPPISHMHMELSSAEHLVSILVVKFLNYNKI